MKANIKKRLGGFVRRDQVMRDCSRGRCSLGIGTIILIILIVLRILMLNSKQVCGGLLNILDLLGFAQLQTYE